MISGDQSSRGEVSKVGADSFDTPPMSPDIHPVLQQEANKRNARYQETVAGPLTRDAKKADQRFLSRIAAKSGDKLVLVQFAEVFWIQSNRDFVCLHSQKGDYEYRTTMNDLYTRLDPDCFLRVHRNAIVNLNHVVEFELPRYGNAFVYLHDGQALPISKTGRMALRRRLLSCLYKVHDNMNVKDDIISDISRRES
jgi:two-component system LytT family response regulator